MWYSSREINERENKTVNVSKRAGERKRSRGMMGNGTLSGNWGTLSRGPHHGLCVSGQPNTLPGQLSLHVLSHWTPPHEHSCPGKVLERASLPMLNGLDTSPTHDPVPSPISPPSTERQPEPTVDGEPKPSATDESSPRGATELRTVPEPEPSMSDQVREHVEHEDAEEGPVEGEQILELGQMDLINFEDIYADMPPLIQPSSELSVHPEPSPLCSPSPHHLCGGLPVSIGVVAGGSVISASSLRVLDSASALQPTSSTGLPRPSGSALVGRRPAIT
ncbi:Zinc metalloprotease ZmpB [Labeo rohita]|uniref:Zinc metalloprotease ZmpB n=1 Tax=Labeo rohita TaxID=84645 RepID=A0ABQ8LWG2_LABRO|nr:Zinc metalloprotease ZmpB [Labeo rohita]